MSKRPIVWILTAVYLYFLAINTGCVWIFGRIQRTEIQPINLRSLALAPGMLTVDINSQTGLTVSGGTQPYTFSIVGAALGSSISSTGILTTSSTTGTITVKVTDASGSSATTSVTIINVLGLSPGMWLKADNITGGPTDGTAISSWNDLVAGNDATQGTGGLRPLFKSNIVNSKPVVRFDGVDDTLASAYIPVTGNSARAIAIVVANATNDRAPQVPISYGDVGNYFNAYGLATASHVTNFNSYLTGMGPGVGAFYYTNASPNTPVARGQISTQATLIMQNYTAGTDTIYVNGTDVASKTTALTTMGTYGVRLGTTPVGGGTTDPFAGDIAEVLVFPAALSAANRKQLECYLGAKYNITVNNSNCNSGALLIQPSPAQAVRTNQSITFSALGGIAPYTYTTTLGSIGSSSGIYTAPSSTGTATVTVTDAAGSTSTVSFPVLSFSPPNMWLGRFPISTERI